ncbi:MAG: arylsulfatase [Opitutaceae bacterium]|nr:arylsulfatase [Opitutaceae bacterium]
MRLCEPSLPSAVTFLAGRVAVFRLVFLLLTVSGFLAVPGWAASKPNVLVILADDLGWGDVSCYQATSAWTTTHLDRLAREGLRFTDAHAASSLCTPSRYALLTGRYAWRGRLKQGVLQGYHPPLIEPGRVTLASWLRAQGYATAAVGKWHLGLDWVRTGPGLDNVDFGLPFARGPLAHGFESFFGLSASLDMPPYVWLDGDRATRVPTAAVADSPPPKLWRAGPISSDFVMEEVQSRLTERAVAFLAERAASRDGRPFFLYLALASPHTPLLPTGDYVGRSGATPYGDFVQQMDADIGAVLAALERGGLADNTLVIVTSDNGFAPAADLPAQLRARHDPSGGLRGYKSDLYEGGHRIPFIVRWPAVIPGGGTRSALIGQHDLFATCADLLDATLPADVAEDSVSFLPVLRGVVDDQGQGPRKTLINHSAEGRFAIREGRWKLLLWPGSGGWSPPTPNPSVWLKTERADLSTLPPFQLYDLETDPAEATNLAEVHPDRVQRLGRMLRADLERGRSTPGPAQPVVLRDWPQIHWIPSFGPPAGH